MSEKFSMIIQNALIILSMVFSVIAFLYSYYTSTKKYELTGEYRKEILNWYGNTLHILKKIALYKNESKESKEELLANLSTQIDIGRFYFPNIDKGDGKGLENPSAFKGYRNVIVDTLVFYYHLFKLDEPSSQSERFRLLERIFISQVFNQINPKEYIELTKKHTNHEFYSSIGFEDFEDKSLIEIDEYLKRKKIEI